MQRLSKRKAVALALAWLWLWLSATPALHAAQTAEEMEAELAAIEQRIAAQEQKIKTLREEKKDQQELLPALEEQIDEVEAKAKIMQGKVDAIALRVHALNQRIAALAKEMAELETQLDDIARQTAEKEGSIKTLQQELMQRLRQQYMSGPVSNLQLLLESDDLGTLLTATEYIARTAERDAALRHKLEQEMSEMKQLEAELRTKQEQLETKKQDLEAQSEAQMAEMLLQTAEQEKLNAEEKKITQAQSEILKLIGKLDSQSKLAKQLMEKQRKEQEELERKLDALLHQQVENGEIDKNIKNAGKMIWPLPYAGTYISSGYGVKRSSHVHRGLDISHRENRSRNFNVVAALDGEISAHGFDRSMGNYVVIYHGLYAPTGRYIKTTYMHLRSFDKGVVNGTKVEAGQVLGLMGSTGRSTGPHLHFQVNEFADAELKSSSAVNPTKYVSKPAN